MLRWLPLLLVLVGAIYMFFRVLGSSRGSRRRSLPPVARPVAPDDDPDFLRQLERRIRRQRHERPPADGPDAPTG